MSNQVKQFLNGFFSLNKSEQKGIIILAIFILLIVVVNQFIPFFIHHDKVDRSKYLKEIEAFQQDQKEMADSIRIEKLQNRGELDPAMAEQKLKPFRFNPNGLSEKEWLAIGLSKKQISTIKNYEAKGGKFYRKEDFKKIYGISDVEYRVLESYIDIPHTKKPKTSNQRTKAYKPKKVSYQFTEINKADSSRLVNNLKLTPWIAKRIVKFRGLLGGFYSKNQLHEVYGFKSAEVIKRLNFIDVDTTEIQKLNINSGTFKQLLKHPYISYEITSYIVNTRQEKGSFNSTEQLLLTGVVSDTLYTKLKHYLVVE